VKLPDNSLGVSDAVQWHECPKLFYQNMKRHTLGHDVFQIQGISYPLAYGNALHAAALAVVNDPEIYIDDAVDLGWSEYSHHLEPKHHAELKKDVQIVIDRTREASSLELVASEQDMSVPLFLGRDEDEEIRALDEEHVWYSYRFKIDALYRMKSNPTHYVIRDFKSTRRPIFQSDVDEMIQFTAYDYAVRELFPDCTDVTIWWDGVKQGEIFSSRTDTDRIRFVEWLRSTIVAILNTPDAQVATTPKMNQWCAYCPLLDSCEVVQYATTLALSTIAKQTGRIEVGDLPEQHVKQYQESKNAEKVLKAYNEKVKRFLMEAPGVYAGRSYTPIDVRTKEWKARDVVNIVGDHVIDELAKVAKRTVTPYLEDPQYAPDLMAKAIPSGYRKLLDREVKE